MGEQIVEYLYFSKKGKSVNVEKSFKTVISSFIVDSQIQCEFRDKQLVLDFDIMPFNDSIHVIFKYSKSSKIKFKEICAFQNILKEINIKASKLGLNHTILQDDNSLYFSEKLLPYLNRYEWSVRKLIYLVSPMHFTEDWIKKSIPKNIISRIKTKLKGEYDSVNLLQELDLSQFEEYLFDENYIQVREGDETNTLMIKEINQETFIYLFQDKQISFSEPYSLWEDVFNNYVNIDPEKIHSDMRLIREGRNIVAHNKELTESKYRIIRKKVKKYIKYLESGFEKILIGDIEDEAVSKISDKFEDYVGFQLSKTDLSSISMAFEPMVVGLSKSYSEGSKVLAQGLGSMVRGLPESYSEGSKVLAQRSGPIAQSVSELQSINANLLAHKFEPAVRSAPE